MRLITHLTHLRYLIGFTGTAGFMLLSDSSRTPNLFFTDFRYRGIAQALEKKPVNCPFKFVEWDAEGRKVFEKCILKKTVHFESEHLTVKELEDYQNRYPTTKWEASKSPIEASRLLKTAAEIAALKKSQKINEDTLEAIQSQLKVGVSELEIAWQIKAIGHAKGAEDISFEPIVAFGAHSAIPHHQNSTRKLKASDVILIDMGMRFKGYCSDMTRTFLPKKPSAEQVNVYQKVLQAQTLAEKACRAGVSAAELDRIARESMGPEAAHFGHSLGHGVGLDVHEAPSLSTRSTDTLEAGMIVTLEPGIYLDGKFGVRIEDMGLVTPTGYQNFTTARK